MSRLACILLAVLAIALSGEPMFADKDAAPDPYVLYRVAGRTWMLKRTPKQGMDGGDTNTSFMRYEVTGVWENRAEYKQYLLDEGKKESESSATDVKVEFSQDGLLFKDPIGFRKIRVEKIKVPAGTFECIRWESGLDNATLWRSVDYPSLIVKSDDNYGTRELVEFDFVEGDPNYKAPKDNKKKKKSEPKEDELTETRLLGSKGKKWILKTTTTRGKNRVRSFLVQQYEVTRADKESCEVSITELTLTLEKLKGAKVETVTVNFAQDLREWLQPKSRARLDRTEKRLTVAGLQECQVYTFEDEQDNACTAWYAKNWPGLLVRQTAKGDEFEQLIELVQFDE